jgi:hypothetical protein
MKIFFVSKNVPRDFLFDCVKKLSNVKQQQHQQNFYFLPQKKKKMVQENKKKKTR